MFRPSSLRFAPSAHTNPGAPTRVLTPSAYAALGLGLLILLAIVASSVLLALRNAETLVLASRTEQIRDAVTAVVEFVDDAETGQRGYLLTGKPTYLEPYRRAVTALPGAIAQLERLISGDPTEEATAAELRSATAEKLDELAQTVALEQAGDRAGALALVQTDRGQRAMQRIHQIATGISSSQQVFLARAVAEINSGGRLLVAIDSVGLALILVLAGVIVYLTRRAVSALKRAQSELSAANSQLENVNELLEEKVARRTADLTEANEEIQRFAYIVSHDLRAPLVNIMGFTSELETATSALAGFVRSEARNDTVSIPREVTEAASEDLPEAIRFIKASTSKMDRLIGAILKLSREGRRILTPEPVQMDQLAAGIVDSLSHQLATQDAEITVGKLPAIVTDRLAIEQVFSNLLENAVKYLQPGRPGKITLRARTAGRPSNL